MTDDDMDSIVTMIGAFETRLVATIEAKIKEMNPQWLNLSKQVTILEEENARLRERHVECAQYIAQGADLLAVIGADEVPADAARRLIKERDEALAVAEWYKQLGDDKGQLAKELLSQRNEAERKCAEVLHRLEALEKSARDRISTLEAALKPLANIADRYDDNGLDECRPEWMRTADAGVELYAGRGGRTLLTLQDALEARSVLRGDK